MGKQKGGAVYYKATRLTSPDAIEALFSTARDLPIPSQTSGQCATDASLGILFYADGVRQRVWEAVFKHAPGGEIRIPDEELEVGRLRKDRLLMMKVFLLTSAARILRILEETDPHSRDRSKSFSPSDEMHDTTPSEVCSNLSTLLISIVDGRKGATSVTPGMRSTGKDYHYTFAGMLGGMIWTILYDFIGGRSEGDYYFANTSEFTPVPDKKEDEFVAFDITLKYVKDENSFRALPHRANLGHAISVIRVNNRWYISDNEVGRLVELKTPGLKPITPRVSHLFRDSSTTYVEAEYERMSREEAAEFAGEEADGYKGRIPIIAQYKIRKVSDKSTIAMTSGVDILKGSSIISDVSNTTFLKEPLGDDTIHRTSFFWRRRLSSPAPRPSAVATGPAAAGAGPPEGGKRYSRRSKHLRNRKELRSTTHRKPLRLRKR